MDKSRKDFEAWIEKDFWGGLDSAGEFDEARNCYIDFPVHMAWKGWQASRKQALEEKEGEHRPTGFMCAIAFDHEVGFAARGSRIFPDAEDLEKHRSCGIYEVELRCIRVVVEPDLSEENLVSIRSLEGNAKETT